MKRGNHVHVCCLQSHTSQLTCPRGHLSKTWFFHSANSVQGMILFSGLWIQQDYSLSCSAFYYWGHGWLNLRQTTKDLINRACYFGLSATLTWLQSTQLAHVWRGCAVLVRAACHQLLQPVCPPSLCHSQQGRLVPRTGRAAGPGVDRDLPGVRAMLPLLLSFHLDPSILQTFAPAGHRAGLAQLHTADGQGLPISGKAGFAGT